MNGFVDEKLRALLPVPVSASREGERRDLLVMGVEARKTRVVASALAQSGTNVAWGVD